MNSHSKQKFSVAIINCLSIIRAQKSIRSYENARTDFKRKRANDFSC